MTEMVDDTTLQEVLIAPGTLTCAGGDDFPDTDSGREAFSAHLLTCPETLALVKKSTLGVLTIVPPYIPADGHTQAKITFTTETPVFFLVDDQVFYTTPLEDVATITVDSEIPHAMTIIVNDGQVELARGILMVVSV